VDHNIFLRLPLLGSEPGIFYYFLFSHSITVPLNHSGSLKWVTTLVLRKTPFFAKKIVKIAENGDHYIDPWPLLTAL
jgi:hypothetical protein